eukprot:scaffold14916_cov128-Isochrysis_galbana.AAC.16
MPSVSATCCCRPLALASEPAWNRILHGKWRLERCVRPHRSGSRNATISTSRNERSAAERPEKCAVSARAYLGVRLPSRRLTPGIRLQMYQSTSRPHASRAWPCTYPLGHPGPCWSPPSLRSASSGRPGARASWCGRAACRQRPLIRRTPSCLLVVCVPSAAFRTSSPGRCSHTSPAGRK